MNWSEWILEHETLVRLGFFLGIPIIMAAREITAP
jgi:hypothetical protein